MIRHLHPFESASCVPGGREFFKEAGLPGTFNPDHFCRIWNELIMSERGVIIGSFDGVAINSALGAVLYPDLNTGDLVAVECFWFVLLAARPNNRGNALKLLFEFEKWARAKNAVRVAMIHLSSLNSESLEKIYARMGYKEVERHYLKDL